MSEPIEEPIRPDPLLRSFVVPSLRWPGSQFEEDVHAEVQLIVTLIYAMLNCGMDAEMIKARIMKNDE